MVVPLLSLDRPAASILSSSSLARSRRRPPASSSAPSVEDGRWRAASNLRVRFRGSVNLASLGPRPAARVYFLAAYGSSFLFAANGRRELVVVDLTERADSHRPSRT
ncbi:hypothetical protein PVAP13_8KG252605 [Panicum virgatum]|uniref:Uncharacterized protein n=1 Tax=Panicum virgatum TaxID=38727 RepID=A0A8T0PJ72_PANVG|nr:hypothetical protein PVAP13_8KG252605 [Panicum virgatum]